MEQIIHAGRVYRYKKGGVWKECWLVALTSGKLLWYNDKKCTQIVDFFQLDYRNAKNLFIGDMVKQKYGKNVPKPPVKDQGHSYLLALAHSGKKRGTRWFYAKSEKDLGGWVKAFASCAGMETSFQFVKDKHTKVTKHQDLRRVPSGDDDDKFRRVGLSARVEDNQKQNQQESRKPDIDWGSLWQEVLHSTISNPEQNQQGGFHRAISADQPSVSTGNGDTGYRSESTASSGADTWDLPPVEPQQGAVLSDVLLEEVMTVVADVHTDSHEKVVIQKF